MRRSALVLAAHGSSVEPAVNQLIEQYVAQLAERERFDVVAAAYNQGDPAYAVVLDRLLADEVTVVPFMTSAGYFCDEVLPRELAKNERFLPGGVRVTAPVGTHSLVVSLVAKRIGDLCRWNDLDPNSVTIALIGHGTPRNERSGDSTAELAAELSARGVADEVVYAYLDDEPCVESIYDQASHPNIIVVPFMIGAGPHTLRDIPSRLGITSQGDKTPPISTRVCGRLVICDAAVGTLPGIVDVIETLAGEAL